MSKRWLVILSLLAHGVILAVALVFNAWRVERLGIDYLPPSQMVLASMVTEDPGGGSPPPAAAAKPEAAKHDKPPVKHKAPVPTQPVATADETPPDPTPSETPGTGSGTGPGTGTGTGTGPGPGIGSGDPCPPDATCVDGQPVKTTPPPPPPPVLISPTLFKALRISGETQIVPPEVEQTAIVRDGRSHVTASVKLCIDRIGQVFGAAIIGSSHYPGYDRRLLDAVRSWRYSPYIVNLQPTPACSVVAFIYTIE